MEMEHHDNSILPVWRSFGRNSRIEVVPNDEEDELILADRNSREIRVINVSDDPECMASIERNCRMLRKCLMGRLHDARYFSKDNLKAMLEKVWNIEQGQFSIKGKYESTLLIKFEDREERDSVLENSPWNVNGGLLMLAPWQMDVVMTKFIIEKSPLWVQIHGLPKDFRSAQMVAKLGMVAGEVRLIDWPENSTFMRVRTIIRPDEPLVAGVQLINQDSTQKDWVEFRYEGVCVLCHRCGVIGHVKKDCTISAADMKLRALSKMKEIRAKLSVVSNTIGLSFLVKIHGSYEELIKGISVTCRQARKPAALHSRNRNGVQNYGVKQIHGDNCRSSSKPKMEWRPKRTEAQGNS